MSARIEIFQRMGYLLNIEGFYMTIPLFWLIWGTLVLLTNWKFPRFSNWLFAGGLLFYIGICVASWLGLY